MSYEEDKPSESLYKPLSGYSSNINPTAPLPEPVTNQEGLYIPPPPSYTTATTVGQGYQALPASYYPAPPHHTRFQTEIKQEDVRKYLKILYFLICISFICCFPFGFIVYFVSKQAQKFYNDGDYIRALHYITIAKGAALFAFSYGFGISITFLPVIIFGIVFGITNNS